MSKVEVAVGLPVDGFIPRYFGVLGSDLLGRFSHYTIDFTTMQLEMGGPSPTR